MLCSARSFMVRSGSMYPCVVEGLSCPSDNAMTDRSRPDWSTCTAVVRRLYRWVDYQHTAAVYPSGIRCRNQCDPVAGHDNRRPYGNNLAIPIQSLCYIARISVARCLIGITIRIHFLLSLDPYYLFLIATY